MILADAGLDATGTVILTVVGAFVGAALAVGLEAGFGEYRSRRHFRVVLCALKSEIEGIRDDSSSRSERRGSELLFDPLYSTTIWDSLVASPESRRLGKSIDELASFYSAVAAANFRTQQVGLLLQTSALATNDGLRISYRNLAQQFSAATHADVVLASEPALAAVDKRLGR